jgi:hypothetical protein
VNVETAWAAGFFDGEGTVFAKTQKYTTVKGEKREYPAVAVSVSQADPRPLKRFVAAIGIGNVSGPYRNGKLGKRPIYYWRVEGKKVAKVKPLIYSLLCEPKREQWDKAEADAT